MMVGYKEDIHQPLLEHIIVGGRRERESAWVGRCRCSNVRPDIEGTGDAENSDVLGLPGFE